MVEAYAFAGTTMTVLIPGAATGGAFTVLHVVKPTGSLTPPHSHDAETEVPYVLSGTLGVEREGRTTAIAAGTCMVLPPTWPHRLLNDSGATVRELLLCAPAYFDRFVASAGTPVEPYAQPVAMTAEDRQRLVAKAPEFGIQLLP
jgi:quercetin dioxygenase-like cupin family protein